MYSRNVTSHLGPCTDDVTATLEVVSDAIDPLTGVASEYTCALVDEAEKTIAPAAVVTFWRSSAEPGATDLALLGVLLDRALCRQAGFCALPEDDNIVAALTAAKAALERRPR